MALSSFHLEAAVQWRPSSIRDALAFSSSSSSFSSSTATTTTNTNPLRKSFGLRMIDEWWIKRGISLEFRALPSSKCLVSGLSDCGCTRTNTKRMTACRCSSSTPESSSQSPDEDGQDGSNTESDNRQVENDGILLSSNTADWRLVRAQLVSQEQDTDSRQPGLPKQLGEKWAHPISSPETGCILVATEKLDHAQNFDRSVVLLLRVGNNAPRGGPLGVILNRPTQKTLKDTTPPKSRLSPIFADRSLHDGGPFNILIFMLNSGDKIIPGFQQVLPGLYFGARQNLDKAEELVMKGVLKPEDFTFFSSCSGWELDQLHDEIENDYWHVAACSTSLFSGSLDNLWEEILQLMGGNYAELSRKPRPDSLL